MTPELLALKRILEASDFNPDIPINKDQLKRLVRAQTDAQKVLRANDVEYDFSRIPQVNCEHCGSPLLEQVQ